MGFCKEKGEGRLTQEIAHTLLPAPARPADGARITQSIYRVFSLPSLRSCEGLVRGATKQSFNTICAKINQEVSAVDNG